jgi:hypothetical protein
MEPIRVQLYKFNDVCNTPSQSPAYKFEGFERPSWRLWKAIRQQIHKWRRMVAEAANTKHLQGFVSFFLATNSFVITLVSPPRPHVEVGTYYIPPRNANRN